MNIKCKKKKRIVKVNKKSNTDHQVTSIFVNKKSGHIISILKWIYWFLCIAQPVFQEITVRCCVYVCVCVKEPLKNCLTMIFISEAIKITTLPSHHHHSTDLSTQTTINSSRCVYIISYSLSIHSDPISFAAVGLVSIKIRRHYGSHCLISSLLLLVSYLEYRVFCQCGKKSLEPVICVSETHVCLDLKPYGCCLFLFLFFSSF